jgi:hypothetical protein|nr:MAG TPA: hypothetical protein [Caudoviricetes sp.]
MPLNRMHGVCHASVGRVQVREDSLVLRNPDIVLFRIVRETQKNKGKRGRLYGREY